MTRKEENVTRKRKSGEKEQQKWCRREKVMRKRESGEKEDKSDMEENSDEEEEKK